MKIGILGGTFNPVHNGHLTLGKYAHDLFQLDEVWFLPNGNPPHKQDPELRKNLEYREEMILMAIKDTPYFKLCDYEMKKSTVSYTYETIQHFQATYPEHTFYFIIGADSLFSIEKWKNPDQILQSVTVLAAYRDDMDTPEEMYTQIDFLNMKYHADIKLLKMPIIKISSRQIRESILQGETEHLPVPTDVKQFILNNHIYQGV